ncbi:unnamed protein product [Boreogadus saida]
MVWNGSPPSGVPSRGRMVWNGSRAPGVPSRGRMMWNGSRAPGVPAAHEATQQIGLRPTEGLTEGSDRLTTLLRSCSVSGDWVGLDVYQQVEETGFGCDFLVTEEGHMVWCRGSHGVVQGSHGVVQRVTWCGAEGHMVWCRGSHGVVQGSHGVVQRVTWCGTEGHKVWYRGSQVVTWCGTEGHMVW